MNRRYLNLVLAVVIIATVGQKAAAKSIVRRENEVVMVIEMTRHGARSPSKPSKKNLPWRGLQQGYNYGELLPAGYRQLYLAGRNTMLKYKSLLDKPFNQSEYYIRSTRKQRTMQTAYSALTGVESITFSRKSVPKMKPNEEGTLPPFKLSFDPKEVVGYDTPLPYGLEPPILHTLDLDDDPLLRPYNFQECKTYYKWATKKVSKPAKKKFIKEKRVQKFRKQLVDYLNNRYTSSATNSALKATTKAPFKQLNPESLSYKDLSDLGDLAISDNSLHADKPKDHMMFNQSKLFRKLKYINTLNHYSKFIDDHIVRTLVSPFLIELRQKIMLKMNSISSRNDPNYDFNLKYGLYATHDTIMTPILKSFKLIKEYCVVQKGTSLRHQNCLAKPPFAGNLVWELIQKGDPDRPDFYIRSTYLGKYYDLCDLQERKGIKVDEFYSCSYDEFNQFIGGMTHVNWRESCKQKAQKIKEEEEDKRKRESGDMFLGLCPYGLAYGLLTLLAVLSLLRMGHVLSRLNIVQGQMFRLYFKSLSKEEKEKVMAGDPRFMGQFMQNEETEKLKKE